MLLVNHLNTHGLQYRLLYSSGFDGLAANVVRASEQSCVTLVRLLLSHFPGFRDTAVYRGRLVHLYKRAQILVGDLWAAYGGAARRNGASSSSGSGSGHLSIYDFTDIDQLTMFADYR